MKTGLYGLALLPFLLLGLNTSVFASAEEIEAECIEKADEKNISDDKYDEFIEKCIAEASEKESKQSKE